MTLVLPPRLSATATALREAAHDRGLDTEQLRTFTVPEGLTGRHLYGDTHFADAVAAPLGIGLLEAPEDWLTRLPPRFLLRDVVHLPIAEAYQLRRPSFIKSANDKSIRAMIYTDGSRLPGPDAVDPDVRVLVSDIVEFRTEVRLHMLDRNVHASMQYGVDGALALGPAAPDALRFADDVLAAAATTLPSAIVVDIGLTEDGWAVIEANAAWASGGYTADPHRLLDVVLRAARPIGEHSDHDQLFVRG